MRAPRRSFAARRVGELVRGKHLQGCMGDDGQIMELPVPKTPDGAHRLGLAIDAQLRAERWAARRRLACWVALAVGGMVVVDSTFAFLSAAVRRAFVAGWWVALAVTVVAAVVEIFLTARLYRAVDDLERSAATARPDRS
jgi:hypothetical protein